MQESFQSGSWGLHSSPDLPHCLPAWAPWTGFHHPDEDSWHWSPSLLLISTTMQWKSTEPKTPGYQHSATFPKHENWDNWIFLWQRLSAEMQQCCTPVPYLCVHSRACQAVVMSVRGIFGCLFLCSQNSSSCPEVLKAEVSGECPTCIFTPVIKRVYLIFN